VVFDPRLDFWENLWERNKRFLESGSNEFRHETSFVAVSSIAEQYYCEYKLENEYALGEIPTEAKDSGTALHDELMPMEKVSREGFAKHVGGRKPALGVIHVWGSVSGLKLVGTPERARLIPRRLQASL
jgi:hypothetical protein